ncbi:alpha/beta fold hydrolase [Shewanella surugensis]|uniref:Alpha/beta hydrolase n=1 Tax=Shewanella surugensis TaxID=212020 RepID=A0ABT0LAI8_9GAMM|nr:alpha/beta fold hydrolase [Shewanella surugensis]MCL1124694.1 alpha/beta hydrolase [Shewanella surugensis]
MKIQQKSLFIPYHTGHLHLRQIMPPQPDKNKPPILMLHGAISNGRVFYSESDKGLACYLASKGFVVYVMDIEGRGQSAPKLSRGSHLGQGEVIKEQLPLIQQYILGLHPKVSQVHWCAHSWGGVLMASALVRYGYFQRNVASFVTFGSKRRVHVNSIKKWLIIKLGWSQIAPLLAWNKGYFPADKYRFGMDNESRSSLRQSIQWVLGDWVDNDDGFDYGKAADKTIWPKTWFIAGQGDKVLGHPLDVKNMIKECKFLQPKYTLLSKKEGFKHDYDHTGMLTHKDISKDFFPSVSDWYCEFNHL